MMLTKLILAHLIGDFLLQPNSWIKNKEEKKLKSPLLYVHALLHGVLPLLFIWDLAFLPSALLIAISHLVIDSAKVLFQKNKQRRWFVIDQLLHLGVLLLVWFLWQDSFTVSDILFAPHTLVYLTAIVALTQPASVAIKIFISRWAPHTEADEGESLEDAGKYIGMLERLFVLGFVVTGHWEAVGFLIAAKSVFRFGDLRESKDRKLTEYILIGTLLSFGMALVVGIAVSRILEM